jgi:hypothetical protein
MRKESMNLLVEVGSTAVKHEENHLSIMNI